MTLKQKYNISLGGTITGIAGVGFSVWSFFYTSWSIKTTFYIFVSSCAVALLSTIAEGIYGNKLKKQKQKEQLQNQH